MTSVTLAPSAPSVVYTNGIFYRLTEEGRFDSVNRSADGGATWTPRSAGLAPGEVWNLEVDPFDPATLYAATTGGLYVFTRTSVH